MGVVVQDGHISFAWGLLSLDMLLPGNLVVGNLHKQFELCFLFMTYTHRLLNKNVRVFKSLQQSYFSLALVAVCRVLYLEEEKRSNNQVQLSGYSIFKIQRSVCDVGNAKKFVESAGLWRFSQLFFMICMTTRALRNVALRSCPKSNRQLKYVLS